MSIALDTALYLREQKSNNPLTLSERGMLFTLLFRVGSNANAWVSQETLAIELDVSERYIRTLTENIAAKGYIKIKQNPKDKRKNLYSPAKFLINYHQQENRAQNKRYRNNCSSNSRDTGTTVPINRGTTVPLSHVAQNAGSPADKGLQEFAQIPKDTIESNIKSKDTISCAKKSFARTRFDDFWSVYPRKKDKKRAEAIWTKESLETEADLIIQDVKGRLLNDTNWKTEQYIPHPSNYLKFERWKDEITLVSIPCSNKKPSAVSMALERRRKRLLAEGGQSS